MLVYGGVNFKKIRHRYSNCHKAIFGALLIMTACIAMLRFLFDMVIMVFAIMIMGAGLTFWGLTRFLKYYYPDKHALIGVWRWFGAGIFILIAMFGLIPGLASVYNDKTVYSCALESAHYPAVFIALNLMTASIGVINMIFCCKNKRKPDRDLAEALDPTNV